VVLGIALGRLSFLMGRVQKHHSPGGIMAATWTSSRMVFLGKLTLAFYLLVYLLT
jgi:hypothetical protein